MRSAFNEDIAFMVFGDRQGDIKSQSAAIFLGIDTVKSFEDLTDIFGGHTDTVIFDENMDLLAVVLDGDLHVPVLRGEF